MRNNFVRRRSKRLEKRSDVSIPTELPTEIQSDQMYPKIPEKRRGFLGFILLNLIIGISLFLVFDLTQSAPDVTLEDYIKTCCFKNQTKDCYTNYHCNNMFSSLEFSQSQIESCCYEYKNITQFYFERFCSLECLL